MRNIFISGSAQEFTSPWTKEKAETFARKLAARMVLQDYRITSGFGLGIGSSVINGALDVIYSSKYKHIDEHLCLRPFPQGYTDLNEKINTEVKIMGYNHGLEKKKFDIEWQKNEKLYRELGMTDDQISAIWEFDYET